MVVADLFRCQWCSIVLGCTAYSYRVAIYVNVVMHESERAINSPDMPVLIHAAPLDKVGITCRHVSVKVYITTCRSLSVGYFVLVRARLAADICMSNFLRLFWRMFVVR
jgi:hypothetical protein